MTENKRFCKGYYSPEWYTVCEIEKDGEVICTVALKDADFIIEILNENEQLKANYNALSHNNKLLYDECTNKIDTLKKENEQLKQLNIPTDEIKETVMDCRERIIGIYYND